MNYRSSWHILPLRSIHLRVAQLIVVLLTILLLFSNGPLQSIFAQSAEVDPLVRDVQNIAAQPDSVSTGAIFVNISSEKIAAEGSSHPILLNLFDPAPERIEVTVVSVPGSAEEGGDYVAVNQTVTFEIGDRNKEISVAIRQDTLHESDETFQVKIASRSPSYVQLVGTGLVEITIPANDPPTPTYTPTRTPTFTYTPTNTPTFTYTPKPTSTDTPTHTPTFTYTPIPPTVTPTWTPSPTPTEESNETNPCDEVVEISADGFFNQGVFEVVNDVDWFVFEAVQDREYEIGIVTPDSSPANVNIETHPNCFVEDNPPLSFGTSVNFTGLEDGPIYLRLNNNNGSIAGDHVKYNIVVKERDRLTIIVAGQLKNDDPLQDNIYEVTNAVYRTFQANGYTAEDIRYLAPRDFTDLSPNEAAFKNIDATVENVRFAITEWAAEKKPYLLNLYIADHGEIDQIYLNGKDDILTANDLDQWLDLLQISVPDIRINIFIEACHSGSFIENSGNNDSISQSGRMVITSSNQENVAYASRDSAYFSAHFLTGLRSGQSIYESWNMAREHIEPLFPSEPQMPWIDSDGNGVPNEPNDFELAKRVGFHEAGTFDNLVPPSIRRTIKPTNVQREGTIQAEVVDDKNVDHVWAVVYPPSYTPPASSNELASVENLDIIYLGSVGNGMFEGKYYNFTEYGTYRILVHADDDDSLLAQPAVMEIEVREPVVEEESNVEDDVQTPDPSQDVQTPDPSQEVQPPDSGQKLFLPFVSQ